MGKLQGELTSTSSVPESALAISAQYRLVGRASAGAGGAEEITSSANMFSLLGAADYAAARALLDLEPGTDFLSPGAIAAAYQPLAAVLTAAAASTYTPTGTVGSNTDAITPASATYLRLGNQVFVFGQVDLDPNAASFAQARLSLPVASDFTQTFHCAGVAIATVSGDAGAILGDTTNNEAQINYVPSGTAAQTFMYVFSYRVLA